MAEEKPQEGYTPEEESQESVFSRMVGSLTGKSKDTYDLLQKVLKNTTTISSNSAKISGFLEGMEGFKDAFSEYSTRSLEFFNASAESLATGSIAQVTGDLLLDSLSSSQIILQDILAGVELVIDQLDRPREKNKSLETKEESGLFGGLTPSKLKPKDKPTVADLLSLPVEHSMGFILLYNKLNDLQVSLKSGAEDGEKKKAKGLAGIFSGLLEGAAGLALLAGALIVFAGAMILFKEIEWGPALIGLFSFGLFVAGMVGFAKWVGKSVDDFFMFGLSIGVLTVSLLIFAAGIFVMNWMLPYVLGAIPGIAMFSTFVGAMGVVAKLTKDNRKDFLEFGVGIAALTGSLILFALGIFVMNKVMPYVPGAIDGTLLFTGFVVAMGLVANLTGQNKKNFQEFGIGIAILTGSLILFAGAIYLMNKVYPLVGQAMLGIGLFTGFVLAMTAISLLVKAGMKDFILFGAGAAILTGALGLFAGVIFLMAKVAPQVPAALAGIATFTVLMGLAVALSVVAGAAMPMFLLFSASALVLSTALISFAKAISELARVRENVPMAIETLKASKDILVEIVKLGGKTIKAAMAFGPAGESLGEALIKFATAMQKLGSIKGDMPFAIEGLGVVKEFILDVAQTTSIIDKQAMKSVEVFAKSTKPLSESMINFAKAMTSLGSIKGDMPFAKEGLNAIKAFLFGMKGSEDVSLDKLLEDVKLKTLLKIGVFGEVTRPIADTIQKFVNAMKDLAGLKKDMPIAIEGLEAIKTFLFADQEITKGASKIKTTSLASLANSLSFDTIESLNQFSGSIKPIMDAFRVFASAMVDIGKLNKDQMATAKEGLNIFKDFIMGKESLLSVAMSTESGSDVDKKLKAFGTGAGALMKPLQDFAATMATLANIKGNLDQAKDGLNYLKQFLFGTTYTENMEFEQLSKIPTNQLSFTTLLGSVSNFAIRKVGTYGDSLSKLTDPINSLSLVMERVSKIDSKALQNARAGLNQIKAFIFGDAANKEASLLSIINAPSGKGWLADAWNNVFGSDTTRVKRFGEAMGPVADIFVSFANVIEILSKLGPNSSATALANMKSTGGIIDELNAFTAKVSSTKAITLDTKNLGAVGTNAVTAFNTVNTDVISKLKGLTLTDVSDIKAVLIQTGDLLTTISNLKYNAKAVTDFGISLETLARGFQVLQMVQPDSLKQLGSIDTKALQELSLIKFPPTLSKDIAEITVSLGRMSDTGPASIAQPLVELLSKKDDIESLTESVLKLANAFAGPKNSLLEAVEKGINAANNALQRSPKEAAEGAAPSKTEPSILENAVNGIYNLLLKWDSSTPGTITTTAGPAESFAAPTVVTNFAPVFAGGGYASLDSFEARDYSKRG